MTADRDDLALARYRRKLAKLSWRELLRERSRVRSIRRNPTNKARMIEAKVDAANEEMAVREHAMAKRVR